MARDITSGFQAEIEASTLRPIMMVRADFDGGSIFTWSGYGDLVYGGNTYLGTGDFLAIDGIEETTELKAASTRFKLSGIPSALISLALLEDYQGCDIYCYFGVLDSNWSLIAEPYQVFKGKMDVIQIMDDGITSEVTVNAESDLIDLRVVRERKYTPEDQKALYPNDRGLDFVPNIQDIQINWGVGVE
jgi:hypothetical protein